MRTEKEIRERLDKLITYRNFLYEDFAPDHQVDEVTAEINALLWVLAN